MDKYKMNSIGFLQRFKDIFIVQWYLVTPLFGTNCLNEINKLTIKT